MPFCCITVVVFTVHILSSNAQILCYLKLIANLYLLLGPSEDTADAFLWMIWQEKVDIVVMVSDMNESAEVQNENSCSVHIK